MTIGEITNITLQGENRDVEFKSTNKIYDDRIEFTNPGGLFGNLKPEDLLSDSYPAKHRNRLLAEAFYLAGEVEKYGTGFIRIRKSLESYPELEIKITDLSDFIKVELGTKDVTKDVGLNVRKDVTKDVTKDVGLSGEKGITKDVGLNVGLNVGNEVKVLKIIQANPKITIHEIAEILGLTNRTVERYISSLKEANRIKRIGSKKTGNWEILKNE